MLSNHGPGCIEVLVLDATLLCHTHPSKMSILAVWFINRVAGKSTDLIFNDIIWRLRLQWLFRNSSRRRLLNNIEYKNPFCNFNGNILDLTYTQKSYTHQARFCNEKVLNVFQSLWILLSHSWSSELKMIKPLLQLYFRYEVLRKKWIWMQCLSASINYDTILCNTIIVRRYIAELHLLFCDH